MAAPTLIKKYGNRRLYDTGDSRYVTLEELGAKVQAGTDVRVVDAKSGEDLTQATLTQLIIEGRGAAKLLPIPLLNQLIRLGDDALAEFFGRYVSGALELYLQAKRGAQAIAPFNPFAALPFSGGDALARMWMNSPFSGNDTRRQPEPVAAHDTTANDVAELRRELDELKRSVRDDAPAKKPTRTRSRKRKA